MSTPGYSGCGCVEVFRQDTGALIGLIRSALSNPTGIATDTAGNLYVADNLPGGPPFRIWIFPPGSIFPTNYPLYDDENPWNVAVASDGTVYVSNSGPVPSVYVYPPGSQIWTRQLLDVNASSGRGLAVDRRGNVYWGISTVSGYQIDKFARGSNKPINLGITLTQAPQFLALDQTNDDLLVSQPFKGAVDIYELPRTLIGELTLTTYFPAGVTLNKYQKLWVGENYYSSGLIEQYTYPGLKLVKSIAPPNVNPTGLAVYPRPY
jgi:hypothetical protein